MRDISRLSLFVLFLAVSTVVQGAPGDRISRGAGQRIQGLFVIGDSALDAGTNRYISHTTIDASTAPYGETYFHTPTGRWTDGRMVADFLAQALGLPLIPPYVKPGANLAHGANFASAGAGLLDETNSHEGVNFLSTQMSQLRELVRRYEKEKGPLAAAEFLRNSVVLFSLGANDIGLRLTGDSTRGPLNQEFLNRLYGRYREAMHGLYNLGFRNIITSGLPPVGCSPNSRAHLAESGVRSETACIEPLNRIVRQFNQGLGFLNKELPLELPGVRMSFLNPYDLLRRVVQLPRLYGFDVSRDACCGGGPFNAADFCANADRHGQRPGQSPKYQPFLCPNPSRYLYFDGNHFTEAGYWLTFRNYWNGDANTASPNLGAFFARYNVPNPPPMP